MTPKEYLARMQELVATGRDADILELARQFGPEGHALLTAEELAGIGGILHSAAMTIDLETAFGADGSTAQRASRTARPA